MIVVKLIGGLGNQLFQYAVGRHLATIHNAELKLDLSGFETYRLHKYSLGAFNIQENFIRFEEIHSSSESPSLTIVERLGIRKPRKVVLTPIEEKKKFYFDPEILKLPDNIYLNGSWQNEKYFREIRHILQQEFTVKHQPAGKDKDTAEQISDCESISLHVRRADYVSNPTTRRIHGICELDYYLRCVQYLAQKLASPYFFIFSDASEWAREHLKFLYPKTFVDHNQAERNYEDLRLMSLCKHHIIANSTFSWWGAWLGQHPEKIVLAPNQWFRSDEYETQDLLPKKWLKL